MTPRHLSLRHPSPPRAPLRQRVAPAALLLALTATTACGPSSTGPGVATAGGGTTPSATASPSTDPRDAAVAFAQCLREHGVEVADPDDRGTVTLGRDGDVSEREMREAHEACKDKAPAVGLGPTDALDAAAQERMLQFSRCMREHGVDMPDPGADGGVRMEIGEDVDLEDEQFRAAEQACRRWFAPGDGPGRSPS